MDTDLIINGISTVAVIYGVIEAFKRSGWLPDRIAPVLALVLGALISLGFDLRPQLTGVLVQGLGLGIAASIGYAGVKKAANDRPLPPASRSPVQDDEAVRDG